MKTPSSLQLIASKKPVQTVSHTAQHDTQITGSRAGLHMALLANGRDFMKANKLKEAVKVFEAILKDAPDHVEANYAMGQIATLLGATRNAVDHVRRTLKHGAGQHPIHYAMAEVCMKHGLTEEALLHIDLAIKLKPDNPHTITLKASILQQLGRVDDAFLLARAMVLANPLNDDAIGVYATSAKFDGTEPEIGLIERAYSAQPQPSRMRPLGYALGKIYNDAKQYDKAFAYFKSGADTYDVKGVEQRMVDQAQLMREAFTKEFILQKRKTGHPSKKPIFVVGMPRSGTTLTEQILASHPDVYGVGELKAMARINAMVSMNDAKEEFYVKRLRELDTEKQFIFGENYLNTVYAFDKTSKHYVDKMPSNFTMIGLINIIFPEAKIIHCTRNPIDNCVSCYTSPLNESHLYAKRLDTLGHFYRYYRDMMTYWKSVSHIPIFDMPYEGTVDNLEGSARALIAHVGLPWDDACLKFNEARGRVSTISQWQVRQPIYSTSVKRWKAYEQHIGPLIEALGDLAVTD
jgi:tetratricopeptide (TPR) repeat protein